MAGITNHTGSKSLVNNIDKKIIEQEKKLKIKNKDPEPKHQYNMQKTPTGGIRLVQVT